ncbi:MAG TPA: ABC transporter substrate-binding protein [Actinopolymorphaceae bacterium]
MTAVVPTKFDPTQAYYIDALAVLRTVTRTMVEMALQSDGKYHLTPDLGTDLGQHNADFTEWTFHLKKGMKYEDGTEIKAQDFAYSVERSFAQTELPGGPTYQITYFKDGDTYKGPYADKTPYNGVSTPDDYTLVMKMSKPFADLPYYMTFPVFSPIPQAKDTKSNYGLHPLASGPYKFGKYTPGKELTLVKNDQWDAASDPGRHQFVDQYDFQFGLDSLQVQNRLIADKGPDQLATTYDNVDSSTLPQILNKEPQKRMLTGAGTCTDLYALDMRKITNLKVRQAIYAAYPFDNTHKAAGDSTFTYEPATTILPKVTPGWENFDVSVNKNGGKGNGDPIAAKKLLTEAGAVGFELKTLLADGDAQAAKVAAVKKEAFEAAGFKYSIQTLPKDKVRDEVNDPNAALNIRYAGWCIDWPSGGTVFPAVYDGRLIAASPTGVPNPSFLNDPKANAEMDRIAALPSAQQPPEWAKLDKTIMTDDLPVIPVDYSKIAYLSGSKVGGTVMDSFAGGPDFTKLFIKQ